MHSFVEPKTFNIGPWQHVGVLIWKALWIKKCRELDELCASKRFDFAQNSLERKAKPWNYHRPCLDTAMAIDPVFKRGELEQIIEIEGTRVLNATRHFDSPRSCHEALGDNRDFLLARRELVEIVVVRDVLETRSSFGFPRDIRSAKVASSPFRIV